jgi:hypothetical protein
MERRRIVYVYSNWSPLVNITNEVTPIWPPHVLLSRYKSAETEEAQKAIYLSMLYTRIDLRYS